MVCARVGDGSSLCGAAAPLQEFLIERPQRTEVDSAERHSHGIDAGVGVDAKRATTAKPLPPMF